MNFIKSIAFRAAAVILMTTATVAFFGIVIDSFGQKISLPAFSLTTITCLAMAWASQWLWRSGRSQRRSETIVTATAHNAGAAQPTATTDRWDQAALDDFHSGPKKKLSGLRLHIRYRDVAGAITARNVTTAAFTFDPNNQSGTLLAFCHLRNANRPFRLGQVLEAKSIDSGAQIANLGEYLQMQYEKTPEFAVTSAFERHQLELQCLYSMSKADGATRAKELAIIDSYLAQRGGMDTQIRAAVLQHMRDQLAGSKQAFWDAVKRLRDAPANNVNLDALLESLRQMLLAGPTIERAEVLLLAYAAKTWQLQMPDLPPDSPTP